MVIGHDTMADYEADFLSPSSTCCGAFVGRYANRIENAEFSVGGATYKLEANNGPNHLHGGTKNFANRIWESRVETNRVVMSLLSEDGDQNYPGELNVEAVFDFDDENALEITYLARTDKTTVVNLTNHVYFNLAAKAAGRSSTTSCA